MIELIGRSQITNP